MQNKKKVNKLILENQIEDLKQDNLQLNEEIDEITEKFVDEKANVGSLTQQNNDLRDEINQLEEEIRILEEQLNG